MSWKTTALVVVSAFALGMLVGWGTTLVPGIFAAEPEVSASPSPSPTATVDPDEVEVPPMEPILRDLDEQDALAGVTTLQPTYRGEGTFTVVSTKHEPENPDAPLRWVSIAVEDGIAIDARAARAFVMDVLQDNRSWGSDGRLEFVETDGVADYRIVFASPFTTAAECPEAHVAVHAGPVVTESTGPSPDAESGEVEDVEVVDAGEDGGVTVCAEDGLIMISMYDWSAGYGLFGTDRTAARAYILNHRMGHLLGHAESQCAGGRADVMDDQTGELACEPNAWPFPDAVIEEPSPSPSSSASGTSAVLP